MNKVEREDFERQLEATTRLAIATEAQTPSAASLAAASMAQASSVDAQAKQVVLFFNIFERLAVAAERLAIATESLNVKKKNENV